MVVQPTVAPRAFAHWSLFPSSVAHASSAAAAIPGVCTKASLPGEGSRHRLRVGGRPRSRRWALSGGAAGALTPLQPAAATAGPGAGSRRAVSAATATRLQRTCRGDTVIAPRDDLKP